MLDSSPEANLRNPTGQHAYVTNIFGDDVAVIDLSEMDVVARIPVGETPNGISFSPTVVDERPAVQLELPSASGSREDESRAQDDEGHGDGGH